MGRRSSNILSILNRTPLSLRLRLPGFPSLIDYNMVEHTAVKNPIISGSGLTSGQFRRDVTHRARGDWCSNIVIWTGLLGLILSRVAEPHSDWFPMCRLAYRDLSHVP